MSDQSSDVLIMGGGLAGASLALQLLHQNTDRRITVLERRAGPAPEAAHKVGESTVEIGAWYLHDRLGLADHIASEQLPKFGLRYFFHNPDGSHGDRFEVGGSDFYPTSSYQFDRGRLENELLRRCASLGARILQAAEVERIELANQDEDHRVHLTDGRALATRYLVDASGRKALLKRQLGLQRQLDHPCSAVWWRVDAAIDIGDWCADAGWQGRTRYSRRLSTNHLMGPGYWVWLIPLGSGGTSVGIVADENLHPLSGFNSFDKALDWLDRHEPDCARVMRRHSNGLQDFLAIRHYAHDCARLFGDRWAITGEAGMFLDPFYSPGSDFIAISNLLVGDLVDRSLQGEATGIRQGTYEEILRGFFANWFAIYQDAYAGFGNGALMSLKILWDFAYYWVIPAALTMHGRLTDLRGMLANRSKLERANERNRELQTLFRRWAAVEPLGPGNGYVNFSNLPCMVGLNRSLSDILDPSRFQQEQDKNLTMLHTIADEIDWLARSACPQLGSAPAETAICQLAPLLADWQAAGLLAGVDTSEVAKR